MTDQEFCKLEFLKKCHQAHIKLNMINQSTPYLKMKFNEYFRFRRKTDRDFQKRQCDQSSKWKSNNRQKVAEYSKKHQKENPEMYKKAHRRYQLKKIFEKARLTGRS